jgi:hypothetical protein
MLWMLSVFLAGIPALLGSLLLLSTMMCHVAANAGGIYGVATFPGVPAVAEVPSIAGVSALASVPIVTDTSALTDALIVTDTPAATDGLTVITGIPTAAGVHTIALYEVPLRVSRNS